MIQAVLGRMADWVVERPRACVAGLIAATVFAATLLPRLEVDTDVAAMLPADHPAVALLRASNAQAGSRNMFLVLRGEGLVEALPGIEERLRASPFLDGVAARAGDLVPLPTEQGSLLVGAPANALEALGDALQPAARSEAIAASKRRLAQDPVAGRELVMRDPLGLRWVLDEVRRAASPPGLDLGSPYLVWPDEGLALLRVTGTDEPFDVAFSEALLDDLDERLEGYGWEGLGGYDVARRDAARIRGDMTSSLAWSIPLLMLFLGISTRSFLRPHLYVIPVALAVVWALGLGGALLGPLTPLAVSSAAILMGLGVDFCIHYLDRYCEEVPAGGHAGAVRAAHRLTGYGLLLGMTTTVAAFLSIGLGSFPGLGRFGLLLTIGIVGSWLAALFALPLLARMIRVRPAPSAATVRLLARLVKGPAGPWLAAVLGVLALAGWGSAFTGGLRFDADARHLRPAGDRIAERLASLESALGSSPLGVRVWVPATAEPAAVAAGIERLVGGGHIARSTGAFAGYPGPLAAARLERLDERSAGWLEGSIEQLGAAGFRPEPFRPALDDLAASLQWSASLPAPDFSFGGRDYRSIVLYPPTTPPGRVARVALGARVRAELGDDILLVDMAGVGDSLGPLLAEDLRRSMGACALVVLLVVAAAMRRPREIVAALLPVFCGLGVLLGALSLWGFPLHPGNLLALPLILGLGVDDGIHMALRWRESAADPLLTTGTSVWRTTASTVIGFGSLATAASPAIASLGLMAAAGASACFLASVLGVPMVLSSARRMK